MERLVIIAAPSCCGKTSFVHQLRNGELAHIAETLQMGDIRNWEYRDAFFANTAMIAELRQSQTKRMILHWTIPHPSIKIKIRNLLLRNSYDKKSRLALIKMAEDLTCLTLVANPNKLIERAGLRKKRVDELLLEKRDSLLTHRRKTKHVRKLIANYSDIEKIVPMYNRWFAFCEQMEVKEHYLVDVNVAPLLVPKKKWGDVVASWRAPSRKRSQE